MNKIIEIFAKNRLLVNVIIIITLCVGVHALK